MARTKTSAVLSRDIRDRIQEYLSGKVGGSVVSRWATDALAVDSGEDALIEEALIALANLDHGDERLDTPKDDLSFFLDCLDGKREFSPASPIPGEQGTGQEN